ncbi:MAG: thioredoxin family protein [Myxococcales bacterium]|nr:thioredoxin family protein [Polyangiaceae bacterium]MDW8248086.1 thioredoxin family protein [Myxococcales bacterium]
MRFAWLAFPLLFAACKDPALNADHERIPSRSQGTQPSAPPKPDLPHPPTSAPSKHTRAKANAIVWDDKIHWSSWEEGLKLARESNKPIFLLVYADWCPHCRNLKAVFADSEIEQLAGRMVMIRQDADDEGASWLSAKVGAYGGYVPRIFFLSPDGTVRPEITSQNPKFPYFYTPDGIALLKASMRKAIDG